MKSMMIEKALPQICMRWAYSWSLAWSKNISGPPGCPRRSIHASSLNFMFLNSVPCIIIVSNILSFRIAGVVRQANNVKVVVERASQIQYRPTLGPNPIIFWNFLIHGCCGTLLIRIQHPHHIMVERWFAHGSLACWSRLRRQGKSANQSIPSSKRYTDLRR